MLTQITIDHLIIVPHSTLAVGTGMTALTGETGAGKSILIDALNLILGDRADPICIQTGYDQATITAQFDVTHCPAAHHWLIEQQLLPSASPAAPFICHVQRCVIRGKRSRATINGQTVTSAQLRTLGEYLINIHGQHAHQALLRHTAQRDLLDDYAGQLPLAARVAAAYQHYRALAQQWQQLTAEQAQRVAHKELLQFQVAELAALELMPDELTTLDAEQRRLAHVGRLRDTTTQLAQLLYDGDVTVHDQLSRAHHDVTALLTLDAQLTPVSELFTGALVQIKEAALALRQYADAQELDPERLQQVEARLSCLHDMGRKYRVAPEQLETLLTRLQTELHTLEHAENTLEQLEIQCAQARAAFFADAQQLSALRQQAAQQLSATVTATLQELGMSGAQLIVQHRELSPESATAHGIDHIEFQVSTNPGQPVQSLAKVASGGELSRISLAIQLATAGCGGVPTLVFDEVDVGIGGGVAEIVGRLLRRLGATRQILCVTHLAQVAAQAQHHWRVLKMQNDHGTHAAIEILTPPQRVDELARMLGGMEITAMTRAHAAELLQQQALN